MDKPVDKIRKYILDKFKCNISDSEIRELVMYFLDNGTKECWLYDEQYKLTFKVQRGDIISLLN